MSNRLFCNLSWLRSKASARFIGLSILSCVLLWPRPAAAEDQAPQWMHVLTSVPLPAHDDKTEAVVLYSEESLNVVSVDRVKRLVRVAYKILRPEGRAYGTVAIPFNAQEKIIGLHGWCIPAQGKDYVVRDKDAMEISLPKIEGSDLVSDVKEKVLFIPAPDPGNIIGFEYESDEQPLVLQDVWAIQGEAPVRERHYSLQLPSGWEYKATWLNHPQVGPAHDGNQWEWTVTDVNGLKKEEDMPPLRGLSAQMIVTFIPPGGVPGKWFTNWRDMGVWYRNLAASRLEASSDIKQRVASLTGSLGGQLQKIKALALFVQHDVRYVAIELGVGGWQPHFAADEMTHRYVDCKDKTTLLASMLREIGVDSYDVRINTKRGSVNVDTPAHLRFNHAILSIKLTESSAIDTSRVATLNHPLLGKLLFFDPT